MAEILNTFADEDLLCVRPSSESPDWGGPGAVLNIGMNDEAFHRLSETLGEGPAAKIYFRFVQGYSVHVARLDPDIFDHIDGQGPQASAEALAAYEEETEEPFPQEKLVQLSEVLRSMARAVKARRRDFCGRPKVLRSMRDSDSLCKKWPLALVAENAGPEYCNL